MIYEPQSRNRCNETIKTEEMSQRRQRIYNTNTLQQLATGSIVKFVESTGTRVIALDVNLPQSVIELRLQSCLRLIKRMMSKIPFGLYEQIAKLVLKSIIELVARTRRKRKGLVARLVTVVLNNNLRRIHLEGWPKEMITVLFRNLHEVPSLEVLRHTDPYSSRRLTNEEIAALSGCPRLKDLIFSPQTTFTDEGIFALLKCPELRRINVYTSTMGNVNLLLGLPNLEHMGNDFKVGSVMRCIHETGKFKEPFKIKMVTLSDPSAQDLCLLVRMFPNVNNLNIYCRHVKNDLMTLVDLNRLKNLYLADLDFYTHSIKNLLESGRSPLTALSLVHITGMDLHALMCISQYHPEIESLRIKCCIFMEDESPRTSIDLRVPPYKKLKLLDLTDSRYTPQHLNFMLANCLDIESLRLKTVWENALRQALLANPMRRLETFYVEHAEDMSQDTVRELINNSCKSLLLPERRWPGFENNRSIHLRKDWLPSYQKLSPA